TNPRAYLIAMAAEAFGWFVDRALLLASRIDPVVFRGLMRVFNMLEPPDRLLRDPELVRRALPVLARTPRGDKPAPTVPPIAPAAALARLGADDEAIRAERFGG